MESNRCKTSRLVQPKFSGHVLVAEDVETDQLFIKLLLDRMGLEVTLVEDGNKAMQKAFAREFDLILMDIHMPHMNGYEVTKTLRKEGIKTPIIALTANSMKGEEKKCIEAGCDDYLAKPLDYHQLLKKIHKYLSPNKLALIEKTGQISPTLKE